MSQSLTQLINNVNLNMPISMSKFDASEILHFFQCIYSLKAQENKPF